MAASYNELFGLGSHSPDGSLLGHWRLQDNAASTVVVDSSGSGNNGTAAANTSTKTTTGPNGWLASALSFNGSSDRIATPVTGMATDFSCLLWLSRNPANGLRQMVAAKHKDPHSTGDWAIFLFSGFDFGLFSYDVDFDYSATASEPTTSAWLHFGALRGSGTIEAIVDGTSLGSTANTPSGANTDAFWIGAREYSGFNDNFQGSIAGVAVFGRKLTSGEVSEHRLGPEPINTAAPSISGSTTVGSVLTCSTGSWNSQSNGTLTYTYQWKNAGSNISGATSSTYTIQSGDTSITCVVRASNDGGYDAAQDTTSNTVTVSGGGPSFKSAWAIGSNVVLSA